MNNYLIPIIVLCSAMVYNTFLLFDTINHKCPLISPTPTTPHNTYNTCLACQDIPVQKNIYDTIIESFPLYYSSMFHTGGSQRATKEEYNKFFKLNPEYSKYKMIESVEGADIRSNDEDKLDKIMFSKLITDTLCSKYISERNKEIVNMDNDQLASWLIEKNNMILLRYSSNRPSSLDVWTMTLKDIETIRPEAVSVLKRNFYKSKEK